MNRFSSKLLFFLSSLATIYLSANELLFGLLSFTRQSRHYFYPDLSIFYRSHPKPSAPELKPSSEKQELPQPAASTDPQPAAEPAPTSEVGLRSHVSLDADGISFYDCFLNGHLCQMLCEVSNWCTYVMRVTNRSIYVTRSYCLLPLACMEISPCHSIHVSPVNETHPQFVSSSRSVYQVPYLCLTGLTSACRRCSVFTDSGRGQAAD